MPESRAKQWLDDGIIEIPPTGKVPRYKRFLVEMQRTVIPNLWTDIPPINSQASDGYSLTPLVITPLYKSMIKWWALTQQEGEKVH
jgi:hypothetical protein